MACTKEMVFQQKLLKKAFFIVKMTGPAKVRPVSSDFWKGPKGGLIESYCVLSIQQSLQNNM